MREDWCRGCGVPLKSATFTQLLEADEALRACQRSYDALASTWTQWGERRAGLAAQLAAQRPHQVAQPGHTTATAAASAPEAAHVPAVAQPFDPAPATAGVSPAGVPEPARASAAPGFDHSATPAQPAAHAAPAPVAMHVAPASPPRRSMAEVFTAPVLLGVSGASLLIAAAIVAVAITWATAAPGVRGVLVLVVAGAVSALAVWLRRLHLVITSGAVGVVAMGFAGISAVAFLSEAPTLSPYSAAVAFLVAGAAGIALARRELAWVGPGSALALAGFAVVFTFTVTAQTPAEGALWAWSITGAATAFGLVITSALWPWRTAQLIAVWAGLGWLGFSAATVALWLWQGEVSGVGTLAALAPVGALVWLSRRWQLVPTSALSTAEYRTWLRVGGIVGVAVIIAGVTNTAAAVVDAASPQYAHSALASALCVCAALLLLGRLLWVDPIVKNVSSVSGVVLAAGAGAYAVSALSGNELPVLAGLGIGIAPVILLAAWGVERPLQGSSVASLLATAWVAGGAAALGAPLTLQLAVAVALAAVAAWTVRLLPARQHDAVLYGLVPALGWGLIAGLWSAADTVRWMYLNEAREISFETLGWVPAAALIAAAAFASARTGPWRRLAEGAEIVGASLVFVAAPLALAVLSSFTALNRPAATIGVVLVGAIVVAAGLAWWRDRTARRLTRIGATAWVLVAGISGWAQWAFSAGHQVPWHFATALGLALAAWVLLVVAGRWWPRVALAPAALLTTIAPLAVAEYLDVDFTAACTFMMAGVLLALAALILVPSRHRMVALIGLVPALVLAVVVGTGTAITAVIQSTGGGRGAFELSEPWWALSLAASLVAAALLIRRLDAGRVWTVLSRLGAAFSVVITVVVATTALLAGGEPLAPTAPERLLLVPVTAGVLGAAAIAWTSRWMQPRYLAVVRWGTVGWATVLTFALLRWIVQERVDWLAGTAVVLGIAGALVLWGRRWPLNGWTPATAVLTLLPFAVVPVLIDGNTAAAACIAAVLVAVGTWTARDLAPAPRRALLWGLTPAAAALLVPLTLTIVRTVVTFVVHLDPGYYGTGGPNAGSPTWWHVGVFAAPVVAMLAWRKTAFLRGWALLSIAVVASAALAPMWAAFALSVTALSLMFAGKKLRTGTDSVAAGVAVGLAMLWSVRSDPALAITALTATVIAGKVALGWRTSARTWGAVVAPATALIAGIFIARAFDADDVAVPAGVGLSMVAVLVLVSAHRDRLSYPVAYTAVVITALAPLFADSLGMVGLAYALGAATWWRLLSAGLTWAKWLSAATASAGTAALLLAVDIQLIEAYTAVPAVALLLIGVQWMRDQPQLRSVTALSPGLAAALVPSYLALVLEPDALWRTIALVGAIIALALVGMRLRWFAPILGTAVTAVVLSVLQMIAGGNLVVRLIAFAVVGALLLGIASYFEKLKELR